MSTAIAQIEMTSSESLSPSVTSQLAATFDTCRQAVWIDDLAGRCVYRNASAHHHALNAGPETVGEILDYLDRPIGRLHIRSS